MLFSIVLCHVEYAEDRRQKIEDKLEKTQKKEKTNVLR